MNLPTVIKQWIHEHANDPHTMERLILVASEARLKCCCHSTAAKARILLQAPETLADINVDSIARQLYLSERTLHRKLKSEQTSFKQLQDEERARRCQLYLEIGGFSADDISEKLGFSDSRSFYRVFKRWHNVPFGEYVKQRVDKLAENVM